MEETPPKSQGHSLEPGVRKRVEPKAESLVLGRLPASGANLSPVAPLLCSGPTDGRMLDPLELVFGTLDLCLSGFSGLGCFIRASLREPACTVQAALPGSSLWPIPPPRCCWSDPGRSRRARRRRRYFKCRAHLLQVVVCCLNWETLGHPRTPPPCCRLGDPISVSQHRVLDHLEGLLDRYLSCGSFAADALGRCAPRFHALLRVAKELPHNEDVDPVLRELGAVIRSGLEYGSAAVPATEGLASPSTTNPISEEGSPASVIEPASPSAPTVMNTALGPVTCDPETAPAESLIFQGKQKSGPAGLQANLLGPAPKEELLSPTAALYRWTRTNHPKQAPACAALGLSAPLSSLETLKVQASRIKWKHRPEFNPLPFISSPSLRAAYQDPELLRRPRADWDVNRPALIHADKPELLALARTWDQYGALKIFGASEIEGLDPAEEVGLFAIRKDSTWDRLILNPTVVNGRMHSISEASKRLSPGWLLGGLHLLPEQVLRFHAADLSDFYHSFAVGPKRALRNRFRARFTAAELSSLDAYSPELREPLSIGLNTLAMGDSLAVEVAQSSHEGLLQQLCGSMLEHEVLKYRSPLPRSDHIEALAIDDHICLQKLPRDSLKHTPEARDSQVFSLASAAYSEVGLHQNRNKDKVACTSGVVLGAELDGELGVVSAPRDRVLCLSFLTALVAHRGSGSRELLDSLVGSWTHVLLFRRPLFCIIGSLYQEGKGLPRNKVFRLSPQSRNELFLLSFLGCLSQASLRATYHPDLFCLDASPSGGAVCSARIGSFAASELWRRSEQRGYYTKLAAPASAVLLEHGLDHEGEFLFGPETPSRAPGSGATRGFPLYPALGEGVLFDFFELGHGSSRWGHAHEKLGLRVHPGLLSDGRAVLCSDVVDQKVSLELASLALRGVVREWHARVPCVSFGTLRRPRARTRSQPAGPEAPDALTAQHTCMARRVAFILMIAVLRGQLVSVEQPASSCLFFLECYKGLARAGCVLTSFCFCSFGSPWQRRTTWLHNKAWVLPLSGSCSCRWRGCHFATRHQRFSAEVREAFLSKCSPSCEAVFGCSPELGQSVSEFSEKVPLPLARRLAAGSLANKHGAARHIDFQHRAATARLLSLPSPFTFAGLRDTEPCGWSSLPITCAWACLRLRRLLRLLLSFDDHSIVGTHSCKWTTPTWCAAYGPDRASRSLSDYQRINKAAGVSTEVVYETDALAAPLRAYGDVLRRVKEGQFLPDNELRNQFVDQFDSSSWQCRRRRRICRAT